MCAPAIRTQRTKVADSTYREIEAASEQRVHQAAEFAGCSPSEMASLKVTNLNDRRDAEVAAMPVNNAVTQQMEYVNSRGGQLGHQAAGSAYGDAVRQGAVIVNGQVVGTGVEPRAGSRAVGHIQSLMSGVK